MDDDGRPGLDAARRRRAGAAVAAVAWVVLVVVAYHRAGGARFAPFLEHAERLAILLGITLCAWWLGGLVGRPLGLTERTGAASLVASLTRWALGLAAASFAWLLLAMTGLLYPEVAWAALGLGVGGGSLMAWRGDRPAVPRLTALPPAAWIPSMIVLLAIALGLVMVLTPPVSTDELMYHLTVPKWYVEHGGWLAPPRLGQAAFPFQVEMLYTWMLLLGDPILAKALHFMMGVVAAVLAALTARGRDVTAGLIAAAVLLSTPVYLINSSWAWVDSATALFVLAGSLQLVRLREDRSWRTAVLAGACWGMALGTKYTALLYLGIALVVIGWPRREDDRPWRPLVVKLTVVGAIAVTLLSPYLVRNAVAYGNPVYPLATGVFGAESPPVDWEGYGDRSTLTERLRGLLDYTLWPPEADGTLGYLYLLAVPLLVFVPLSPMARRLHVLGGAAMVILSVGFAGTARLQVPALCLLAVPIGEWLAAWWQAGGGRRALAAALLVTSCGSNLSIVAWHDRELFDPLRVALGYEPADAYVARMEESFVVLQHLNRETPPGTRVLAIGAYRLFHLDRPVVSAGPHDVSQARDWIRDAGSVAAFVERIRAEGVDYILFDREQFARDVLNGPKRGAWTDDEMEVLEDFLASAEKVVRNGDTELYRVPAP